MDVVQGMVVEYRSVEDLLVFQPMPMIDEDKAVYLDKASNLWVRPAPSACVLIEAWRCTNSEGGGLGLMRCGVLE